MSSPENGLDAGACGGAQDARFGALLQHYRTRAGLTQTRLADFSTVSVRAIRDLELGRARRPRRETVRLLAEALRLSDERKAMLEAAAGRGAGEIRPAGRQPAAQHRPIPPPATAGPILGRRDETLALYELLAAGRDRLVTVLGLGGVGKTRLTLAVAHELNTRLGMPVLWLAAERRAPGRAFSLHPAQVAQPWLRDLLANADDAVDDLAAFISERSLLLVLDGPGQGPGRPEANRRASATREHALSAEAQLTLLARCPNLRIVSTLRTTEASASALLGQRTLRVSPLAVGEPPEDAATQDAAIRYAAADTGTRADRSDAAARLVHWHLRELRPHWRATNKESAAIRDLCRSLDGIPRALESAAAWSLVFSPTRLAAIAERDPFALTAPPSDRTGTRTRFDPVRAALAEAIDALTGRTRRLLSLVSRWDQPWSLDQAAARTGYPFDEISAAVHTLLVHDLIRPAPSGDEDAGDAFSVLNLVRALIYPPTAAYGPRQAGPQQPVQPPVPIRPLPIGRAASSGALTRR